MSYPHRSGRATRRARAFLGAMVVAALPAQAQVFELASRPASAPTTFGDQGDADAFLGRNSVTPDGRYVVFASRATNLVTNDDKRAQDIFRKDLQTGTVELVSVASGTGGGDSHAPSISANGRWVVFSSDASNLVAGDTNGASDIFLRDMVAGTTERVSVADDEQQGSDGSFQPSVSDDGMRVAFLSQAANLVLGDTNLSEDVFVRDRTALSTIRVSVDSNETQSPNGAFAVAAISGNGLYVAFQTVDGLDAVDTNFQPDVYRRNLSTTTTELVSIAVSVAADADSINPAISADGMLVAFESGATNIVAGDTNAARDVFVRDMVAGTTTRASVDAAGTQSTGNSFTPALSRNGLHVGFDGPAPDLVPGDTNGFNDVFVKTLATGAIARASVSSAGAESNGQNFGPASVTDAGAVVYGSRATNLVAPDVNAAEDVLFRSGSTTVRVNRAPTAIPIAPDGASGSPVLSANGRYVVFESDMANLDAFGCAQFGGILDVFRRDLQDGSIDRLGYRGATCTFQRAFSPDVSDDGNVVAFITNTSERNEIHVRDMTTDNEKQVTVIGSDVPFTDASGSPAISGDATFTSGFVAFVTAASNVLPGDANGLPDVYVRNLAITAFERVSVSSGGTEPDAAADAPAISDDGRYVAFQSRATNLAAGDTNARMDVFVRDRQAATTTRVSVSSAGGEGNADSLLPAISADGRYVAFESDASNLVLDDTNGSRDVFVHDRVTGETTRASLSVGGGQVSGDSGKARLSGDGRFVVFTSDAVFAGAPADGNAGAKDVFVHDRLRKATWRATVDAAGVESASPVGAASPRAAISEDGARVAFASPASEWIAALAGYQPGGFDKLFVANVAATTLLSVDDTPDPTPVGATIDVKFTVAASSGSAAGNVSVAASTGETCGATLAVGVCQLTFNTAGTRTLDIVYSGSQTHFPARTPAESHQVEPPGDADGFTGETPLVAPGGGAGDQAGMSVASSDEFVVVGAPNGAGGDGAVYVFRRVTGVPVPASAKSVAGLVAAKDLVPVATLTNSGGAFGDKWGSAVAISGDGSTIVVGAPEAGAGGAAFTFSRPGSNWTSDSTPDASLVPAGGTALGDKFGSAVAIGSGNMVAVGAPGAATGGNPGAGSATVFNGTNPIATLAPDPATADANANFGQSLAMSGNRLVIGSPNENAGGRTDSGAVRLYTTTANSVGAPTSLAPSGGAGIGDKWGTAVAIDGTTVVGGAPGATGGNGAGFVFQDTGGGFTQRGMLTGGPNAAGSAAGSAVSVAGDYILLGAPLASVGGNPNQGRAFVFLQPDGGWTDASAIGSLERANGTAGDNYGAAVVLTRRGAIVGIPNSDLGLDADRGEADSFVVDRIFKATFE